MDEYETVLGVVQLPTAKATRALPVGRTEGPSVRYFAKRGLLIKPGATFTLRIVDPEALDAGLGWGNPAEFGRTMTVDGCHGSHGDKRWLVYAGGYETNRPGCLTVEVATPRARQRVQIGVGEACPGQDGPPPGDG